MYFQNKSRKNGYIGTILFHLLLLSSFFFLGLSAQDPPPEEIGIAINFGETYEKSKNQFNELDVKNKKNQKLKKSDFFEQKPKNNNIVTQDDVDVHKIIKS